ncbi:MAG: DUF3854 domain-containing protein [Leptolyngbya sp. SIO1D8]|nr:DUF3854 domain-containing protein [Leptolyngbya sp. SIO1D8]
MDPLNNFEPSEYGRFKADTPRTPRQKLDSGEWVEGDKAIKYDAPAGMPFRVFWPKVSIFTGYKIAEGIGEKDGFLERFRLGKNTKSRARSEGEKEPEREGNIGIRYFNPSRLNRRAKRATNAGTTGDSQTGVEQARKFGIRAGKNLEQNENRKKKRKQHFTNGGFSPRSNPSIKNKSGIRIESTAQIPGLTYKREKTYSPFEENGNEECTGFWEWYLSLPVKKAPFVITEGSKKAAALISSGIAAVALPGVDMWHAKGESELHPDLKPFCTKQRPIIIAFDQDKKLKTTHHVGWQTIKLGNTLEGAKCRVRVASWPKDWGKGIDDAIVAKGGFLLGWVIQKGASNLIDWQKSFRTTKALGELSRSRQVNLKPERETEGEYLPDLPTLKPGIIHVVDATMNTGKTFRIGRDWVQAALSQGIRVIGLSPLNSLGKQTAAEWGIFHVHDQLKAEDKKEFWEEVRKRPGMVLCPDSIGKLPQWFFDTPVLLIVDEGNQVTNHICQGETLKSRYGVVLPQIEEVAKHAIQSGGSIVLAEDGIPDRAIQFWQAISGAQTTRYFRHRKQGVPWPTTIYSGAVSGFRAKLLAQLEQPEPLFFVSSSQRECKRLEKIASAMGKKVFRIDSETNEGGAYEMFFSAPDKWISIFKPEVLILSPSGKSGLSIQGKVKAVEAYFKTVWAYFPALDTDTHMQILGRYRPSVERHIYCPPFIAGNADEQMGSRKRIKQQFTANIHQIAKLFALQSERKDTQLEVAIQNYLAEAFTISGLQKSIAQSALIARLENAGHDVKIERLEGDEAAAQTWKDFQEIIWIEEAEQFALIEIEEGQTVDWAWATLDSMESTYESRIAARKVLWRDAFPGISFDDPVMCYEMLFKDYGKMRKGIQLQARIENLEGTREQEAASAQAILDSPVRSGHRVPKNYAKALLLERIGILSLISEKTWSNADRRAITIWEKCTGQSYKEWSVWRDTGAKANQKPERKGKGFSETIYYWLRLQTNPTQTPVDICNKLIRKFGFTVDAIKRPGGGNTRDRIYQIKDLNNPFRKKLLEASRIKLSRDASATRKGRVPPPVQIMDAEKTLPTIRVSGSGCEVQKNPQIGESDWLDAHDLLKQARLAGAEVVEDLQKSFVGLFGIDFWVQLCHQSPAFRGLAT